MSLDRKQSSETAPPPYGTSALSDQRLNSGASGTSQDGPPTILESVFIRWSESNIQAFSGAASGLASSIVTCPLDVIKTKLQAQGGFQYRMSTGEGEEFHSAAYRGLTGTARTIWKQDGLKGMYRGVFPMILGYVPTWAVWFSVYNSSKGFWADKVQQGSSNPTIYEQFLTNLLSSVTAGGTSTLATNPIWVIKTRLMAQVSSRSTDGFLPPWYYRNTFDAARKMYRNEGILSFYSGLTPALLGLTHVAIQFPLYEYFKMEFCGLAMGEQPKADEKNSQYFGIAVATFLSKLCASVATYPHEVLRTRLQTQQRSLPAHSPEGVSFRGGIDRPQDYGRPPGASSSDGMRARPRYSGIIPTFKTILREEGWRAFYAGMGANMFRAVPAAMTTMLTYELCMQQIQLLRDEGIRKSAAL